MTGLRWLPAVIRTAGIVCAVLALATIVRSYAALRDAAANAALPVDALPASLWPYVVMAPAGLLAGDLAGHWARTRVRR